MTLKHLAKTLGITPNAVRKAMDDGRITAFKKTKDGYVFDEEIAVREYELNTNQNLSSNPRFGDEGDEFDEDGEPTGMPRKSVLDKDPKTWNANEALQAKTIYSALKVKHELEVQQGHYYEKKKQTWSSSAFLIFLLEDYSQFRRELSKKYLSLLKINLSY
jgi:hypothetical protein